jgi:anti-sigma factor RsiW
MEHEHAIKSLAVEAYLLNQMTLEERDAFEEHYFSCPECAEQLCVATRHLEDLKASLGSAPLPIVSDNSPQRDWFGWLRPSFAVPAFAALLLSLGAYTYSLHQQLNQPQLMAATFISGQTRGAATEIRVAPGGAAAVTFDVPESSAAQLHYVLEDSSTTPVFSLDGPRPQPGQPVTLQLPRNLAAGTYALIVQEGTSGPVLDRYPVRITKP